MDKEKLFSIGEFSQITGATIKALHYYEKINILKPAWIDDNTGYRYYNVHQLPLIEAIELLLDLDIRLNQLSDFLSPDLTDINYKEILHQGKILIKQKTQDLENKMRYIDYLQKTLNTAHSTTKNITDTPIWLMPYDKTNCHLSITEVLKIILQDIRPYNLKFHHYYGRIMFCNGKEQRIYYFIDLKVPSQQRIIHENIFYLPEGSYRFAPLSNSKLENAKKVFKDLFDIDYDKIVIETENSLHCLLPLTTD